MPVPGLSLLGPKRIRGLVSILLYINTTIIIIIKLTKVDKITSFHNKKTFKFINLPPRHRYTCELSNVIYIINCTECGLQYIGETKRPIRQRMYEYYRSIQKFNAVNSTPVSRHFTQPKHSVRNMEFSIVQWMGGTTTQIPPLNVKDRNYSIFGPSPPFTPWVSTYLCEFMPSYCTPTQVPTCSLYYKLCPKCFHEIDDNS